MPWLIKYHLTLF
ncbi:UNVERIFIED_CONTAM: hypothetical protein GTU68_000827 [Idotea baltica]|nr:hypothetical protein [Idotea baltica]